MLEYSLVPKDAGRMTPGIPFENYTIVLRTRRFSEFILQYCIINWKPFQALA